MQRSWRKMKGPYIWTTEPKPRPTQFMGPQVISIPFGGCTVSAASLALATSGNIFTMTRDQHFAAKDANCASDAIVDIHVGDLSGSGTIQVTARSCSLTSPPPTTRLWTSPSASTHYSEGSLLPPGNHSTNTSIWPRPVQTSHRFENVTWASLSGSGIWATHAPTAPASPGYFTGGGLAESVGAINILLPVLLSLVMLFVA